MSVPNLYDAPEQDPSTQSPQPSSDLRGVRIILYVHLAAILLLAVFSLSDTGRLKIPTFLERFFFERFIQFLLVMTWFVCPVLMGVAATRLKVRSDRFRIGIVMLDIVLSILQIWVMLPLVQ